MPNKLYALLFAAAVAAPTALLAQEATDTGAATGDVPAEPVLLTEEAILLGTVVTVFAATVLGDGDSTDSTTSTPSTP